MVRIQPFQGWGGGSIPSWCISICAFFYPINQLQHLVAFHFPRVLLLAPQSCLPFLSFNLISSYISIFLHHSRSPTPTPSYPARHTHGTFRQKQAVLTWLHLLLLLILSVCHTYTICPLLLCSISSLVIAYTLCDPSSTLFTISPFDIPKAESWSCSQTPPFLIDLASFPHHQHIETPKTSSTHWNFTLVPIQLAPKRRTASSTTYFSPPWNS